MNRELREKRSHLFEETRGFFKNRGYLEVDTPLLSPYLIPESSIEIFKTDLLSPYRKSKELYLIPSPEIWMKRLLVQGSGNIFQITKSFRNWEQTGRLHENEFTLLEWYTLEADYRFSMEITEDYLSATAFLSDNPNMFKKPFLQLSMQEAFFEYTGLDLEKLQNREHLFERARELDLDPQNEDTWETLFHRIFVSLVEPRLPQDKPLFLYDYPTQAPCLAKKIPGTPWVERWELYVHGVELANCFTEETDREALREYFSREGLAKEKAEVKHRLDPLFPELFPKGFPKTSGVALGFDRLLMLLTDTPSLGGVIFFPLSDIVES